MLEISVTSVLVSGALAGFEALDKGDAEFTLLGLGAAVPFIHGGRLRALGVSASHRTAQLPDVPTLAEAGLPGFEVATDFALFAPTGTPEGTLTRLNQASIEALSGQDVMTLLAPIGVEPVSWTPRSLRWRCSRCRSSECHTHRSSGGRWWSWSDQDEHPRSFPGRSSRRRSRSGTVFVRPSATVGLARRAA